MRRAGLGPGVGLGEPLAGRLAGDRHGGLDADRGGVAPRGFGFLGDPRAGGGHGLARDDREPAVGEAADSPQHRRRLPATAGADPDRDRALHRQRVDARALDAVPLALEGHLVPRPEQPQQLDLLVAAAPARAVVLPQRRVLLGAAADADAEPQPAAAQHVELRRLLGDERRLPRGQDDHRGHQLDRRGQRRHPAEQRQRLVEVPAAGPHDHVRDAQVGEAQLLGGPGEVADAREVVVELADGERDADSQAVEAHGAYPLPARSLISAASEKSYSVMPPASCVLRATPTRL